MSMSNYASYADTVSDDFVEKTCPEEYAALLQILEENDYDINNLAYHANWAENIEGAISDDLDKVSASLIGKAYNKLCIAFKEKTNLALSVKYHDKEDRGDEVNGLFWMVDGVYVLSSAGKKYKKEIERKFWTTFG